MPGSEYAELLLAWSASLNDGRRTFQEWLDQTERTRTMTTIDKVRSLFVEGREMVCLENTYIPHRAGFKIKLGKVGKTVYHTAGDENFRGTFPTRASDVIAVDDTKATWKIGRGDHTVTWAVS